MYNKTHNAILAYELANRSLGQVIIESGFLIFIALAAFTGNSCVLYVFYKTPSFRKVANYYLITLAISDVTMAVAEIPLTIGIAIAGKDILGKDIGQFFALFGVALIYGSLLTTVLIAVNRFFCVVKPKLYKKYFKPRPAIAMIAASWLISLGTIVVPFLDGTIVFEFYPGRLMYYPAFTDHTKEIVLTFVAYIGFMGFPALVSFCYWKIYRTVKGHNANVSTILNAGPHGAAKPTRDEINITMSLLPLACGCILCYYLTSSMITADMYINLPRSIEMLVMYVLFINSAINPFIFNVFNKPFRKEFLKLIFGYASVRVAVASFRFNRSCSTRKLGPDFSAQNLSHSDIMQISSDNEKNKHGSKYTRRENELEHSVVPGK